MLQIAAEVLKEFRIDPVVLSEHSDSAPYSALLHRLADDSIVRNDLYTGARIVEKEVANSYIEWLINARQHSNRSKQASEKRLLSIDFNRMAFFGSIAGSWGIDPERKVYEGGVRAATVTARAVLTLAKGDELYSDKFEISYLVNSRIMRITGGNHRLLAYKLLGIAEFPTGNLTDQQVTLYDDSPNERLNTALLCLESLYTSHDPRNNEIKGIPGNEELVMQLAEAYGAYSESAGYTGLYDFVKEDLAQLRSRLLNRLGQSEHHNPTLADLADYANAYQCFQGYTSQSWLTRLVKGRGLVEQLSSSQKEIHGRLVTANMNNV